MDPNSDTVRSMSELLKMDESYQQELQEVAAEESKNALAQNNIGEQNSMQTPHARHRPALIDVTQTPTDMDHPPLSPSPSIRSQMSRTESTKPKREYKLKGFILFLFLVIVVGVTIIFMFYKNQLYMIELGRKIIVDEKARKLTINDDDKFILEGHLGTGIPEYQLPFDCTKDKTRTKELCLVWNQQAQVFIDFTEISEVHCYDVKWISNNEDIQLKDCFTLKKGHWYGGGLMQHQPWPLLNVNSPLMPFISGTGKGNYSHGSVVEPYWLSSEGLAIYATPGQSLMISWNDSLSTGRSGNRDFCLATNFPVSKDGNDNDGVVNFLNYTICTGNDVVHTHQYMSKHFYPPVTNFPTEEELKSPIWSLESITEMDFDASTVLQWVKNITLLGFKPGLLKFGSIWEKTTGDLSFDDVKFPDVSGFLSKIASLGFKVSLAVSPYIITSSKAFVDSVSGLQFVTDSGGNVPGLTQIWPDNYLKHGIGGVLEFDTTPSSWFKERLKNVNTSGIGSVGIHFVGGQAEVLPHNAYLYTSPESPNTYTEKYSNMAATLFEGRPLIMQSVYRAQHLSPFIQIDHEVEEEINNELSLESLIPAALTLGISGYPLVLLPPVGGTSNGHNFTLPSKEYYIRSIQLASFFPIMQFSVLPNKYDEETIKITKKFIKFHDEFIVPKILRCLQEYVNKTAPVIRPLWWIAPNDPEAHMVSTEFLIGNDTLVAPKLDSGNQLNVYLPEGSWRDGISHQNYEGPQWIDFQVPLDQSLYFMRLE